MSDRVKGDHSRRRRSGRRLRLGVLIGLPVMVIGLLFAAEVADEAAGCGSIDPTDPANYSAVTIVNDTPRAVILDQCLGGYCHAEDLPRNAAA